MHRTVTGPVRGTHHRSEQITRPMILEKNRAANHANYARG